MGFQAQFTYLISHIDLASEAMKELIRQILISNPVCYTLAIIALSVMGTLAIQRIWRYIRKRKGIDKRKRCLITIVVIAVLILAPAPIELIRVFLSCLGIELGLGGLLSFYGTSVGVIIAALALHHSIKHDQESRRQSIKPYLQLQLIKEGKGHRLRISNSGQSVAFQVTLGGVCLAPVLQPTETCDKIIVFFGKDYRGDSDKHGLEGLGDHLQLNIDGPVDSNGLPENLCISARDCDGNEYVEDYTPSPVNTAIFIRKNND